MLTVYKLGDLICTCNDKENVCADTIESFFKNLLCIKDQTVFVYDFQLLGLFLINALEDLGFMDATIYELSYTGIHKLDRGTYKYTLSSENHSFYNISYNHDGKIYTFYEFKNIMSSDIKDVVKDFGGFEPVAMHRAVAGMRGFSKKATTVSGCAYSVWKKSLGISRGAFDGLFPECDDVTEKICRDAYHGGLCYLQEGIGCKELGSGVVIDANSLYPYVMKTKSFPIGKAHKCFGCIPDEILNAEDKTYYVRFKARFELKKDHIPFARTRCDKRHWQLETLKTSAYIDRKGNRYDFTQSPGNEYVDEWGEIHFDVEPIMVELCMYKTEFELFFEQYDVYDIEYIEYVWFKTAKGIFKNFVDHFYEMKKKATGKAERRMYKIILNALSGRMSLKTIRKSCVLSENAQEIINSFGDFHYKNKNGTIKGKYTREYAGENISSIISEEIEIESRSTSHIQIGAAITSEAMCHIVRLAQANYKFFRYTDTDSLHLGCTLDEVVGVEMGDELGQFKVEHTYDRAVYYGEKVYILDSYEEGQTVTWAGMPEDCQNVLEAFVHDSSVNSRVIKNGGWGVISEEERKDFQQEIIKTYEECKPECYTKEDWRTITEEWRKSNYGKDGIWELFHISIPHSRLTVKSYKNYEFCTKTEFYTIDKYCVS